MTRFRFSLGLVAGAALGYALAAGRMAPAHAAAPSTGQGPAPVPAMPPAGATAAAEANTRAFTIVGTEFRGTKFWSPGTLICYQGERIKITLTNKIQGDIKVHGFAIPDFGIRKEVEVDKTEVIEFVADKPGLHALFCHLHPAHIGGQLLVLTK